MSVKFNLFFNLGERPSTKFVIGGEYVTLLEASEALTNWIGLRTMAIERSRWEIIGERVAYIDGFIAAYIEFPDCPHESIEDAVYPPFGCIIN